MYVPPADSHHAFSRRKCAPASSQRWYTHLLLSDQPGKTPCAGTGMGLVQIACPGTPASLFAPKQSVIFAPAAQLTAIRMQAARSGRHREAKPIDVVPRRNSTQHSSNGNA